MLSPLPLFVSLVVGTSSLASAAVLPVARQAPNTLYPGDPVGQTASWNLTAFVLPISKSLAQSMAAGHKLLQPQGLPAGYLQADQHPLIVYGGLEHDIRQLDVTIPNLVITETLLPFVDASDDGKTPFGRLPTVTYISQLVPALAGALQQGNNMVPANFDPPNAAYKSLGGNQLSFSVNVGITTSVLGAPTPDAPVVNAIYAPVSDSDANSVNPQFFYGSLNSPYQHTDIPTCTKQTFIFNESFANPFRVKASTIQLLPPTVPSAMTFSNVYGVAVATEWDNPFGPGQPCSALRAQAQAVQYQ